MKKEICIPVDAIKYSMEMDYIDELAREWGCPKPAYVQYHSFVFISPTKYVCFDGALIGSRKDTYKEIVHYTKEPCCAAMLGEAVVLCARRLKSKPSYWLVTTHKAGKCRFSDYH